jgi:hypothetical protein
MYDESVAQKPIDVKFNIAGIAPGTYMAQWDGGKPQIFFATDIVRAQAQAIKWFRQVAAAPDWYICQTCGASIDTGKTCLNPHSS